LKRVGIILPWPWDANRNQVSMPGNTRDLGARAATCLQRVISRSWSAPGFPALQFGHVVELKGDAKARSVWRAWPEQAKSKKAFARLHRRHPVVDRHFKSAGGTRFWFEFEELGRALIPGSAAMLHDVSSSAPGRSDRLLHTREGRRPSFYPATFSPIALPLGSYRVGGPGGGVIRRTRARSEAAGLNAKAMLADNDPWTVFKATCS